MKGSQSCFNCFINNDSPIVCYGAGWYGHEILGYLRSIGKEPAMFVVSTRSDKKTKLGVPIVAIDDIDLSVKYNWIISTMKDKWDGIISNLSLKGISRIFLMDDDFVNEIRNEATKSIKEVKDQYNGERCFLVATGPSIKYQNLSLLRNEHVISCSFFPLMDCYHEVKPDFYVDPSIYIDNFGKEHDTDNDGDYGVQMMKFHNSVVSSKVLFLDYYDRPFVQQTDMADNKTVYYLYQRGRWYDRTSIYDVSKKTPEIQTASVMMLKVAMYMGFKKIYLLGAEHNMDQSETYDHAYDYNKIRDIGFNSLCDMFLEENQKVSDTWGRRRKLGAMLNIFNQYYYLHNIAKANGIKIFNATKGGSLDEFERVEFESLF